MTSVRKKIQNLTLFLPPGPLAVGLDSLSSGPLAVGCKEGDGRRLHVLTWISTLPPGTLAVGYIIIPPAPLAVGSRQLFCPKAPRPCPSPRPFPSPRQAVPHFLPQVAPLSLSHLLHSPLGSSLILHRFCGSRWPRREKTKLFRSLQLVLIKHLSIRRIIRFKSLLF